MILRMFETIGLAKEDTKISFHWHFKNALLTQVRVKHLVNH